MASVTRQVSFSAEQERWYAAVRERFSVERLKRLLVDLVNIHSPTGAERELAEFLAGYLKRHLGGRGFYQPVSDLTGNCFGEVRSERTVAGARLMLYAPLDTHLDAAPEVDVPWVGPALRPDMVPQATVDGDFVIGLGASNPKSMVATLTEVAIATYEADVPLLGLLQPAFAGGGMSVNSPRRRHYGLGDGVYHLISRGIGPDFAIVMKPIWAVYSEEPGLCWFRIMVHGTLAYAGSPRTVPGDRSSILPASVLIPEIDEWIKAYTARNAADTLVPEGKITAVHAGWSDRFAYSSATTEIYVDVRCTPAMTLGEVNAQFAAGMEAIRSRHPQIDFDWEMIAALPGGATDPEHWIVQSCRRGWERVEGRPHGDPPRMGGRTDGALIRRLGIPAARIGFPWPAQNTPDPYKQGMGGMGVAYLPDLVKCADAIIYAVVDTLTRPRSELGL